MLDIHLHFKGRNFMTPNVIRYGSAGQFIYELSSGRNINDTGLMYGVTVKHRNGDSTDLSVACITQQEALDYIRTLATL